MKKIFITLGIALALTFGIAMNVSANASYFMPLVTSSTATSSPSTINPTASTTLVLDSYTYGSTFATNQVTLLVQHTASTSASILGIAVQYSQDGIDWFDNNLTPTSTIPTVQDITLAKTFSLSGNVTASTTRKAITLGTPTRFIRAVFTSIVATSTVWAEFVPMREIPTR